MFSETSNANPTSLFNKNNMKVDFCILSAMQEELGFFQNYFLSYPCCFYQIDQFEFKVYEYKNKLILLANTGFGTTFSASVVTLIHYNFHPDYIFFSGTAGGIHSKLNVRDVIIAEKAFEAEIQGAFPLLRGSPFESCLTHPLNQQVFPSTYLADNELLSLALNVTSDAQNLYVGTVVSSNTFPAPQELFDQIKTENPYSIDMETSAIYQVAWLLKIKVLAVRGISNILNHNGTDDKIHESDVQGSSEAAAKVVLKIVDALLLQYDIEHQQENNNIEQSCCSIH